MKTMTRVQRHTKMRSIVAILGLGLLTLACSNDDDNPAAVDEEEVITTMNIRLTSGTFSVLLQSQDLDGDGPNPPEINVVGDLKANTDYTGRIELLNETTFPVEDITKEVSEEDDEHQFFFAISGAFAAVAYTDRDSNANPLGLGFTLTTGDAGIGTIQVTLRHEPKKPNDGTLADAGGETDIAQTFSVVVVE